MTYSPGIYDDISNEDYHADPALSSSGARLLIKENPEVFRYRRTHPEHKDVYDFGTVAHSMVLEGKRGNVVEVKADNWRTKAAQDAKEQAREDGQIAMLTKELAIVKEMTAAIREHRDAMALLRNGRPEMSAFYRDRESGVDLRTRFDWLPEIDTSRRLVIPDYKTAASANPNKFAKSAADFGFHQQDAWYTDTIKAMGLHDDVVMVFIVQEKTAPYTVSIVQLSPLDVQRGRDLNRAAIYKFKRCTENDHWPGYEGITMVELPVYSRYHEEEIIDAAA